MNQLLLLAVMMVGPEPIATTDAPATCEINHYFDDHARYVFTQAIYFDVDGVIIDWRLMKCADQIPTSGKAIWWDGHTLRKTLPASTVETWTMYDPEVTLRNSQPKESRTELHRPPSVKRARELAKER